MAMTPVDRTLQNYYHPDLNRLIANMDRTFILFSREVLSTEQEEGLTADHYHINEYVQDLFNMLRDQMSTIITLVDGITNPHVKSFYKRRSDQQRDLIGHTPEFAHIYWTSQELPHLRAFHWKHSIQTPNSYEERERPLSSILITDINELALKILGFCDFSSLTSFRQTSKQMKNLVLVEREDRRQLFIAVLEETFAVLNQCQINVDLDAFQSARDVLDLFPDIAHNSHELRQRCMSAETIEAVWKNVKNYFVGIALCCHRDRLEESIDLMEESISYGEYTQPMRDSLRHAIQRAGDEIENNREIYSVQYKTLYKLYLEGTFNDVRQYRGYHHMTPFEQLLSLSHWANHCHRRDVSPQLLMIVLELFESSARSFIPEEHQKLSTFISIVETVHDAHTLQKALTLAMATFQGRERLLALRSIFSLPIPVHCIENVPEWIQAHFPVSKDLILLAFLKNHMAGMPFQEVMHLISQFSNENDRHYGLIQAVEHCNVLDPDDYEKAYQFVHTSSYENGRILAVRLLLKPLLDHLVKQPHSKTICHIRSLLNHFPEERSLLLSEVSTRLIQLIEKQSISEDLFPTVYNCVLDLLEDISALGSLDDISPSLKGTQEFILLADALYGLAQFYPSLNHKQAAHFADHLLRLPPHLRINIRQMLTN